MYSDKHIAPSSILYPTLNMVGFVFWPFSRTFFQNCSGVAVLVSPGGENPDWDRSECLRCILSIDIEYVVILFRKSERGCKSTYQERYTQSPNMVGMVIACVTQLIEVLFESQSVSLRKVAGLSPATSTQFSHIKPTAIWNIMTFAVSKIIGEL